MNLIHVVNSGDGVADTGRKAGFKGSGAKLSLFIMVGSRELGGSNVSDNLYHDSAV